MTTTVTESPQGAPNLATLHALGGSLLILVGILLLFLLAVTENPRRPSPFVIVLAMGLKPSPSGETFRFFHGVKGKDQQLN